VSSLFEVAPQARDDLRDSRHLDPVVLECAAPAKEKPMPTNLLRRIGLRDSGSVVAVALAGSALIHLLPLTGLAGAAALQALYGLPPLDAAGELLLRHRALMFALDAALLLWAIRTPVLRTPAIALTLASDVGFLALGIGGLSPALVRVAIFDALSIGLLLLAAWMARRSSSPQA